MFKKIVLQVAMQSEADPIIAKLNLTATQSNMNPSLRLKVYEKIIGDCKISLVTHGVDPTFNVDRVGPEAATLATSEIIRVLTPDLIINAGTAGGLQDAQIGDVYIGTASQRHDVVIPIPGFDQFGKAAATSLATSLLQDVLELKFGLISTGTSLDAPHDHLVRMKATNTAVKDMEASAIAQVARLNSCPVIFVKAITDIVEKDTNVAVDFMANLSKAMQALANQMILIVPFILGKTPYQLNANLSHLSPNIIFAISKKFIIKLTEKCDPSSLRFIQQSNKKSIATLSELVNQLHGILDEKMNDNAKTRKMLKLLYTQDDATTAVLTRKIIEKICAYRPTLSQKAIQTKEPFNTTRTRLSHSR